MVSLEENDYPAAAYAPDGKLWWDRVAGDGPKGATGNLPRAASWLRFNVQPGERFTTEQVRSALGITAEHFQRRLRELRGLGWKFDGMKDSPGLNAEYRMREYGWWPGADGEKPKTTEKIDSGTRRAVMDRDGSRCRICGVGAAEPYPDPPYDPARITIGHVVPASQGGGNSLENLRCECSRCNETVRAESGSGESFENLLAGVRNLRGADKKTLLRWLKIQSRERTSLDQMYDRVRLAAPGERAKIISWLEDMIRE